MEATSLLSPLGMGDRSAAPLETPALPWEREGTSQGRITSSFGLLVELRRRRPPRSVCFARRVPARVYRSSALHQSGGFSDARAAWLPTDAGGSCLGLGSRGPLRTACGRWRDLRRDPLRAAV